MTSIPELLRPLVQPMADAFTRPTFKRFFTLMAAAVLNTGRRTVSNLLRTAGGLGHRPSLQLPQRLLPTAMVHMDPGPSPDRRHPPPLRPRRAHPVGRRRHRRRAPRREGLRQGPATATPVRSTHSYTAWRWGHKWVVLAVLVKFPFASRPWALPVLVALYRTPEWDREHGRRHKTPCGADAPVCWPS